MNRYFYYIKTFLVAAIMFFALSFERTVSVRLFYFLYLTAAYVVSGIVRGFFANSSKIKFATYFIDIAIIFAMESLTRYVINYALHTFYIITMVEAAKELNKKQFLIIAFVAGAASLAKYVNMLLLSSAFTKVAETVFFTLFTVFIVVTLYLFKRVNEEKLNTEMVYNELLETYKNLENEHKSIEMNFKKNPLLSELTDREKDICRLIAQGKNNKEISEELFISEGTVKNHITNILKKLELRDRTQLAVFSLRNRV
jgi:DNA-binding CsgD family transcriptional regulator